MLKWLRVYLLSALVPFLVVMIALGAGTALVMAIGDPVKYPRPSSLFFPQVRRKPEAVQRPPIPPVVPPARPKLNEYVAEGSVNRKITSEDVREIRSGIAGSVNELVDATTTVKETKSSEKAKHLAVIIAFDDSGSMMGNDRGNERYRVVLRLLKKLNGGDLVCLTRTTESSPQFTSEWCTPEEAAAAIQAILDRQPQMNRRLDVDEGFFSHRGTDLFDGISARLPEADPGTYKRTLLFLGDGDSHDFGYRPNTVEGLVSESVMMSGVIFGPASATLEPGGQNHYLVDDAQRTGGEVRAATDVSAVDALMQTLLDKAKRSIRSDYTLRVRFRSPERYGKGDEIRVLTEGDSYTLKVR